MTKTNPIAEGLQQAIDGEVTNTVHLHVLPDPAQSGITHLRTIDPAAMRLWSVKGPKGMAPTELSAVTYHRPDDDEDVNRTLLMHQFEGGKFVFFAPVKL